MMANGEQKNQTGVVGSLATLFSETSNDHVDTVGEGPRKRVRSRLLPSPRAPRATRVSPPPRLGPRVGRVPGGRHILRPGLGRGRELFTFRQGRLEGTPGRSCGAHPHAHPPAAPPALHRGRPKSHREPRERPWGAGRERGADSGAQTGRRALHKDLGPPDASTQTQ